MASDYRAKFTKCPFYRREASARIVCEGIPPKSTSSTNFSDSAEKKEYKKTYCERSYEKCLMYQALMKKYDE